MADHIARTVRKWGKIHAAGHLSFYSVQHLGWVALARPGSPFLMVFVSVKLIINRKHMAYYDNHGRDLPMKIVMLEKPNSM